MAKYIMGAFVSNRCRFILNVTPTLSFSIFISFPVIELDGQIFIVIASDFHGICICDCDKENHNVNGTGTDTDADTDNVRNK